MTIKELVRKVVCDEQKIKTLMVNGRDIELSEYSMNLKVKDFRIVVNGNIIKIHVETK